MYAIVEITGKQYKIAKGDKIEVDTLNQEEGKVTFDNVLLYAKDEKNIEIGNPYVAGATVEAEIIENKRGTKIRVFKMKPKKRYEKRIGHRRQLTTLEIVKIGAGTSTKPKTEPKAKAETETN